MKLHVDNWLVGFVLKFIVILLCLALIRLTDGNTAADGYLEIFSQGEWYTMCSQHDDNKNAAVICRELGYKGAVTSSSRCKDYRNEHLLWYSLHCYGNEDSVFNCFKCCDQFYEKSYYYCLNIPEYTCQSKSRLCYVVIATQLSIIQICVLQF